MKDTVIARLAQIYPQLYLDPDQDSTDCFRDVVLKGTEPQRKDLSGFHTDPRDREELLDTPAGKVQVVTLYDRSDFERFLRCMMAAKEGVDMEIPASQGAATLVTFNWPRIHARRREFIEEEHAAGNLFPNWQAEWKRFTAVKSNYMDHLVVLSVGPYSAVDAACMGCTEEEWIEYSNTIRKYHELTHVICRILYPDQIDAVWDELAADAIGIYAAYGRFDPEMQKRFLGIRNDSYIGGRLENYTDDPGALIPKVNSALSGIDRIIREHAGEEPFSMIAFLEAAQEELFGKEKDMQ